MKEIKRLQAIWYISTREQYPVLDVLDVAFPQYSRIDVHSIFPDRLKRACAFMNFIAGDDEVYEIRTVAIRDFNETPEMFTRWDASQRWHPYGSIR